MGTPCILGQDINDGQQIFVPLIPSTEFLHIHQVHLPLFVPVKHQGGGGGKPSPSRFVQRITQHRLEHPLRLRSFQFMGMGKGFHPTQSPGFMGILISPGQRHHKTDTRWVHFILFNRFFSKHMSKQDTTTILFMHKGGTSSPSLSLGLGQISQTELTRDHSVWGVLCLPLGSGFGSSTGVGCRGHCHTAFP